MFIHKWCVVVIREFDCLIRIKYSTELCNKSSLCSLSMFVIHGVNQIAVFWVNDTKLEQKSSNFAHKVKCEFTVRMYV